MVILRISIFTCNCELWLSHEVILGVFLVLGLIGLYDVEYKCLDYGYEGYLHVNAYKDGDVYQCSLLWIDM